MNKHRRENFKINMNEFLNKPFNKGRVGTTFQRVDSDSNSDRKQATGNEINKYQDFEVNWPCLLK